MISEGLRKHAFWLYGVIVGLAIQQALQTVVGRLIVPPPGAKLFPSAILNVIRLPVFLFTILQFYLGSVWFFDKFHEDSSGQNYSNFAVDFLFGLVHFIVFFAWAMSIDTNRGPIRVFPILMIFILLYDLLWCRACRGRASYSEIRKWTYVNIGVVIGVIALYAVTYLGLVGINALEWGRPHWLVRAANHDMARHKIAEGLAVIPVLIVSTVDIIGMITGKQIIADWVLDKFKATPLLPPD